MIAATPTRSSVGCDRSGLVNPAGRWKPPEHGVDPDDFDGLLIVEPGLLGPRDGSVVLDIVEPGYQPKPDPDIVQREIFSRGDRPSVVITIARHDQVTPLLRWPDDFAVASGGA